LRVGFAEELNLTFQEMPLTPTEQAQAEQLRTEQYANETWNQRV
jgi:hypothetical protein